MAPSSLISQFGLASRRATLCRQLRTQPLPAMHVSVGCRWRNSGSRLSRTVTHATSRRTHARYYWLVLAESHLTRRLFAGMVGKIAALPSPAG
jgi:hypothetical protein